MDVKIFRYLLLCESGSSLFDRFAKQTFNQYFMKSPNTCKIDSAEKIVELYNSGNRNILPSVFRFRKIAEHLFKGKNSVYLRRVI